MTDQAKELVAKIAEDARLTYIAIREKNAGKVDLTEADLEAEDIAYFRSNLFNPLVAP